MVDPEDLHRYEGEESWPSRAQLAINRLRKENAALQDQLNERGPRPIRYMPDYTGIEGSNVFLQWKGTDVCLDFHCDCGAQGHFDGYFAYALRCSRCGRAWMLPHSVAVLPLPDPWESADPVDVTMDFSGPQGSDLN